MDHRKVNVTNLEIISPVGHILRAILVKFSQSLRAGYIQAIATETAVRLIARHWSMYSYNTAICRLMYNNI